MMSNGDNNFAGCILFIIVLCIPALIMLMIGIIDIFQQRREMSRQKMIRGLK